MKPGTLVMAKIVGELAMEQGLRVGSIGEIVLSPTPIIKIGHVCVKFPGTHTAYGDLWQALPSSLVPISDPDADISEQDDIVLNKDIEEKV